jgi:hypothetical protein
MATNDQIRRAQPSIDSPLGRLIKGEITEKQYRREVADKRQRESSTSERHAAQGRSQ